jgi:hypothetical protein
MSLLIKSLEFRGAGKVGSINNRIMQFLLLQKEKIFHKKSLLMFQIPGLFDKIKGP